MFRSTCAYAGFTDVYDFKHLYKPLGYLSNVWASLLIGFAGITLLSLKLHSKERGKSIFLFILLILLSFNLIVSFSRGVYLTLLLVGLIFPFFSGGGKARKHLTAVALLLPLLVFGLIYQQDVSKTLRFNQSQSQQRSISGRVDAMTASYRLVKASPLTGSGAGTYSQVINDYRYENDNGFTSFAPNGYTQLLTEQGIIGFLLWGALFATAFFKAFMKRKDSQAAVITTLIILAVLIREASFPVLFESRGFQLLFFTGLAVFQNTLPSAEMPREQKRFPYFPVCAVVATLLIGGFSVFHHINEQNIRKAMLAFEGADLENAESYIRKTPERVPFLINRSIIDIARYKKTNNQSYLEDAKHCLEKAHSMNSRDNMIGYRLALVMREQGKNAESLLILKDLADRFPEKSLYQISVFDALYKSGQHEAAFPCLLQSVKSSPHLLNSRYVTDLFSKDVPMKESLQNELLRDISKESATDPVILAKHGSLLLSLGFENEAKKCLEQTILLLPNLLYPYYYLSKIETNQNNNEQAMIYLKKFVFLSL